MVEEEAFQEFCWLSIQSDQSTGLDWWEISGQTMACLIRVVKVDLRSFALSFDSTTTNCRYRARRVLSRAAWRVLAHHWHASSYRHRSQPWTFLQVETGSGGAAQWSADCTASDHIIAHSLDHVEELCPCKWVEGARRSWYATRISVATLEPQL